MPSHQPSWSVVHRQGGDERNREPEDPDADEQVRHGGASAGTCAPPRQAAKKQQSEAERRHGAGLFAAGSCGTRDGSEDRRDPDAEDDREQNALDDQEPDSTPSRRENCSEGERARSAAPAGRVAPPVNMITPFMCGDDEAGCRKPVQREERRHHAEGAADEHRARVVEARPDQRERNTCRRCGERGEADCVEMERARRSSRHGRRRATRRGRETQPQAPRPRGRERAARSAARVVVGRKRAKL